MIRLISLSLCLFTFTKGWAQVDLGRYQLILDKQLLGTSQAATTLAASPNPPETVPGWANAYRMTMMTRDGNRVRIGLQHVSEPISVLLIEGESRHPDFELLTADFHAGSATVSQSGIAHQFILETAGKPLSPLRSPGNPTAPSGLSVRGGSPPRTLASAEEPPEPKVRRFQTREELEAHLQEQQMEAYRSGKPPLPVPLTLPMDNQLVREGVLPPREE